MKKIAIFGLALVVCCGVLATPQAEAGWLKKDKAKRTEMPEWMKKAQRFDNVPEMSFLSGELQQDGWTGWKVGEVKIQFAKGCVIMMDGEEGASLDSGRSVMVMGPRNGDTITAWNISIEQPSFKVGRTFNSEVELRESNVNSDCGEVIKAPM